MELQRKRRNIITSIDSKIKDVKKQLEDLIKQREKLRLMSLCRIPENKYIHDLTAHLQLEYEEADFEKGEYSDYVDGNLIISYNFINEDEKVKVILEVNLSSDKTYDCREIPNKYFDINLKVTSNTTEKITNLEKKIDDIKKRTESSLQFKRFWEPSKVEKEDDKKIEDKANEEIDRLMNELEELKRKEVNYEEFNKTSNIVINNKQKMYLSKVDVKSHWGLNDTKAGEMIPSEDNWEYAINCVLNYVSDNTFEDWFELVKEMKFEKILDNNFLKNHL